MEDSSCLGPDSARPPPCGADHTRKKLPISCWRRTTNKHKDRWTSFAAATSRDEAHPGARASRPHTSWHSPEPPPPPGSTGNGARILHWPSPCRSRRPGGRVPHRRETERHATGQHAGGTPALPGGASSHRSCSSRGHAPACRGRSPADAAEPSRLVDLRVTSWMTLFVLRAPSWIEYRRFLPLVRNTG